MWVFVVFGCLAAAALVARQVVHNRELRRRHEEAQRLTRRRRPLTEPVPDPADPVADPVAGPVADPVVDPVADAEESRPGDVPAQREVVEERDSPRTREP